LDLREKSICLLASVAAVDMQTEANKEVLFTVPAGKAAIITHVVVRNPTLTLATCDDCDLGIGALCDTWKQSNNFSTLVAATDFMVITSDNTMYAVLNAAEVFGIYVVSGSAAAATATIDVFGYLYDA